MGFWELVVISIVALIVLGPDKLPGAVRSVGKFIRSTKQLTNSIKAEVSEELRIHELHENLKKAEEKGLSELTPDLQASMEELKEAAESVRQPYKKSTPPNQSTNESALENTQENTQESTLKDTQESQTPNESKDKHDH